MGLKRGLWRSTGIGRTIDTVKNIVDEGSISGGVKRMIKEDLTEDNPLGKMIYDSGRYDGKKEGYEEASAEYEHKLIEQADLFLKQTRVFEEERDEYEKLLDEYDKEIELLENKADNTDRENKYLQELLLKERKLIQLIPEDEDET